MCLVLGRPGTIDWRHGSPALPADVCAADTARTLAPAPRNPDKDPPKPLTRFLWQYVLTCALRGIQDLEHAETLPADAGRVDKLHGRLVRLYQSTPPMFRLESPDTRWDELDSVAPWIQWTRHYFYIFHCFSLMILHRPYVFHRKESRTEALRASLALLDAQRLMFEGQPSATWKK